MALSQSHIIDLIFRRGGEDNNSIFLYFPSHFTFFVVSRPPPLLDSFCRLLVALPVDGGDLGRALELEIAVLVEILLGDLEPQSEAGCVEVAAGVDDGIREKPGIVGLVTVDEPHQVCRRFRLLRSAGQVDLVPGKVSLFQAKQKRTVIFQSIIRQLGSFRGTVLATAGAAQEENQRNQRKGERGTRRRKKEKEHSCSPQGLEPPAGARVGPPQGLGRLRLG